MNTLILQAPSTHETRAIRLAAVAADAGGYLVGNATLEGLASARQQLQEGALPVGSVEFVREAMRIAGIKEPANLSYPNGCEPFLGRKIHERRAGSVVGQWFVKPRQTKLFNGFLFDTMQDPDTMDQHDREQYDIFMGLHEDTPVMLSEPVRFISEWRYYVDPVQGQPVGCARYDPDGAEDEPRPCQQVVADFIQKVDLKHPYAADFGVTDDGQTVLVEVNDFWALGLYHGPETLSAKNYLRLLQARWQTLCNLQTRTPQEASIERRTTLQHIQSRP